MSCIPFLWDRETATPAAHVTLEMTLLLQFNKQFPLQLATDDMEASICLDQDSDKEDVAIELLKLYVQRNNNLSDF